MLEKQFIRGEELIEMTRSEYEEAIAKAHEEGYQQAAHFRDENVRLHRLLDGIAAIAESN